MAWTIDCQTPNFKFILTTAMSVVSILGFLMFLNQDLWLIWFHLPVFVPNSMAHTTHNCRYNNANTKNNERECEVF